MGKQEIINNIIQKLKTDPFYAVSLYDERFTKAAIGVNLNAEKMIQSAGSVEEFFNQIFKRGIDKLGIQVRRQNGHQRSGNANFKAIGEYQILELSTNENAVKTTATPQPVPAPSSVPTAPAYEAAPVHHAVPMNQPIGLASPMGLSMPEIINLHVDRHERLRLEREIAELKPKYDSAIEKIKDYERRERDWTDQKAKAESNADMFGKIMDNIHQVPALLSAVKGGSSVPTTPGLGLPNDLTQNQNELIQFVADSDPANAIWILEILQFSNSDAFVAELETLKQKYKAQ